MLVTELMTLIVQLAFVYLTATTGIDYIRHRHPTRLIIFLMFFSLSAALVTQPVMRAFNIDAPWLTTAATVALLAHPYLVLRLGSNVRALPSWAYRGALGGLVLSAAAVILLHPLPKPVTLLIVAYFGIYEIYAATIFIRGTLNQQGVTRQRLRMASVGSALLGGLILVAGLASLAPALAPITVTVIQVALLASTAAFYLAFATPRWLRKLWRSDDLLGYLRASTELVGSASDRESLLTYLGDIAAGMVGGTVAAVAVRGSGDEGLTLLAAKRHPQTQFDSVNLLQFVESLDEHHAGSVAFYKSENRDPVLQQLFDVTESRSAYFVPIKNTYIDVGYLIVFSANVPLFMGEMLDFLDLLAQQSTLVLENQRLIDQLHSSNELLEEKVEERTVALIESEGRYHRIIDGMLEGFQILDFDWQYLYVNDSAARYGRVDQEALVGHGLMEVYPGIEGSEMFAAMKHCMEERTAQIAEFEFTYEDGTKAWFQFSIQPVPEGISILSLDVTERRQATEALRLMNEELERRVAERTRGLEAANKELEAFAYSVSHDLRAPLRAMGGFSKILQQKYSDDLPERAQHFVNRIHENASHMGELIDDLLTLSRLGRKPLDLRKVEPETVIRNILNELDVEMAYPTAEVQIDPLPACEADPILIKQAYLNLITNALKYSAKTESPCIHIGSEFINDELVYYVKDNGVGFDMRFADKLFGVFERLHTSDEYEGTGIGLATVQRAIHRHGGRVWAESEVGQGASFYFTLDLTGDLTGESLYVEQSL